MENLAQLEALCERLYNSQDPAERSHSEQALLCFSTNQEYIQQCQFILDSSSSPYAQLLASSSLVKQVTDQILPVQLRLDIRKYLNKAPLVLLAVGGFDIKLLLMTTLI